MITQRNAETLRYFENLAPVGEWFQHDRMETAAALGISKAQLVNRIRSLIANGYMKATYTRMNKRPLYCIIKPSGLAGVETPKRQRRPKSERKLIRYAGWERSAASW